MNSKKTLAVTALAVVMLVAGLWIGRTSVAAADSSRQTIVDKLSERFSLNKDEVTGVFDEIKTERQQERLAAMEERLNRAVEDGVITADQKQALVTKHQEMFAKQEQLREEMQTFLEASGIDFEKLSDYHLGMGGKSFGGHHGMMMGW